MKQFLVGIDDTDVVDSPGTGRLARELAALLELGGAQVRGVTRHQLLRHPSIPYTSQNSSACLLVIASDWEAGRLGDMVEEFLLERHVNGADPALAVLSADSVDDALIGIGRRAKQEKLEVEDVRAVAIASGVDVRSVAGDEIGIVGAVAAVGLRGSGNDGRFIDLPGIRLPWDRPAVGDILAQTDIARVIDAHGRSVAEGDLVAVDGWLRPSLIGGEATLVLARNDGSGAWQNIEIRSGTGHRFGH